MVTGSPTNSFPRSRSCCNTLRTPRSHAWGVSHKAQERDRGRGNVYRGRINGFTLLEIMLVMVLLGIAISAILPSLMPEDSGAQLQKEARRLVMLTQTLQEQALINGQDMGMQQTSDGYQFLIYQQGKWQPVTRNRTLSSVKLNKALRLAVLPGESIWRDTLELEQDKGFTFADSSSNSEDEQQTRPDLFFWASGEISPAELRLLSAENSGNTLTIRIEEHGTITLAEGAEL